MQWRQVTASYTSAFQSTIVNAYRLYGGRTRINVDAIERHCPPALAACIVSHRQVSSPIFNAEVGFDEELLQVVPESTRLAFIQEFDTFRDDFQSHPRAQWTVSGAGSFEMPDDLETGKVFTVVSGWVLVAVENLHAHDARFDEKVFRTKETLFVSSRRDRNRASAERLYISRRQFRPFHDQIRRLPFVRHRDDIGSLATRVQSHFT